MLFPVKSELFKEQYGKPFMLTPPQLLPSVAKKARPEAGMNWEVGGTGRK